MRKSSGQVPLHRGIVGKTAVHPRRSETDKSRHNQNGTRGSTFHGNRHITWVGILETGVKHCLKDAAQLSLLTEKGSGFAAKLALQRESHCKHS